MQHSTSDYNPDLHDKFKALSVKQPYAEYIASGEKTIEVRSKPTKYRGEIVICSSKDGRPSENAPGYGCTLAKVELYDCKPLSMLTPEEWEKTKLPQDMMERYKSNATGYGWFLRNPTQLKHVPIRGQLGIFNLVLTKGVVNQ